MTEEVKYCFEDEDIDDICENMSDIQVRRLPVMNRNKRLMGIVSLGDLVKWPRQRDRFWRRLIGSPSAGCPLSSRQRVYLLLFLLYLALTHDLLTIVR